MARRIIDIGAVGNDGTGDSIRDSFRKVNDNFRELYSSLGLGERLSFIGLDDTPASYAGLNNIATGATPLVTINNFENGLTFKQLTAGNGISLDFTTNPNEITINSEFAEISADTTPQLGGNLSARSGLEQYRILDLPPVDLADVLNPDKNPKSPDEAISKAYADTKIARAGVNSIDPATGRVDSSFGRMSGPLILSRDPEPDDDLVYGGLIAATKRYVDSSSFASATNLYVALSGDDERPGVSKSVQGRALAYAYRTLEAALKRAEELILEAPIEIGPYKKVLTFNDGAQECTLSSIDPSPLSGSGFIGSVRMSVDTVTLASGGVRYYPGDRLSINGGTVSDGGGPCIIEVLTTTSTPGTIVTFRIVSIGSYTAVPGSSAVGTTISASKAPSGVGAIGEAATFNLTYKVNSVGIVNSGSGYSLVSVRVIGGGGAGAFGTAVVTGGSISSITITDTGSGFTSVPTLTVDLPRFAIRTDFFRTDFTGTVTTDTAEAIRGRDIREGLFLRGETSGALGQILAHSGELDSNGNELFDMDIKFGTFEIGETISYGDITKNIQVTILVESGEYYENYPLKVPQNVSIVGDEFRRCIIRPKTGTSSSPWAFQKFRRDLTIDGLAVSTQLYGHHYLQDISEPVYPKINNKGDYDSAAALIDLNKQFIQEEIIAWIDRNIVIATPATTWYNFTYDSTLYKKNVGLLVDAIIFDLKYGEYNRTISAGLKYYETDESKFIITNQLNQYRLVLSKLNSLIQSIILNSVVSPGFQSLFPQIVDLAFSSEVGSGTVITELLSSLEDVIDGSGSVNYPKENNQMDVFLANDAVRWQAISAQGHGGFMLVLDPQGQILAKSPYAQECASFSKSNDRQTFAGGMFVDGFTGNLQFKHIATDVSNTRLSVTNLDRAPNLPASFLVDDTVYRINYVRDFVYNKDGSSATFVLDETTPFTRAAGSQTCTISNGNPAVITRANHRLQGGAIIEFSVTGGSLPTGIIAGREYFVLADGLTNDTFNITATFGSIVKVATTSSGSGTFAYQRTYEVLMPGNRSMLSNDFTQINDMGYGIIAQNGGLVEAVSMFTYYCYISYYSLNGGQIRSVGGSSAHGIYALVAEGADPLEVPTAASTYEDLAQKVVCYFPSSGFANTKGGKFINVYKYDYVPNSNSELEIDHNGAIFRYPIVSVSNTDLPAGVFRLNLSTGLSGGTTDGLFEQVPNNTPMTLRQNGQILLTGSLEDVAVRPSTGLKLRETADTVYRILQFSTYTDSNGPYEVLISNSSPAIIKVLATVTTIASDVCTTSQNHKLRIGDKFIPTSTANGFTSGTTYYIVDVPEYNQFKVSTIPGGTATTLLDGTGLTIKGVKTHKQLENYTMLFSTSGTLPSPFVAGVTYNVVPNNLTDTEFTLSDIRAGLPINTTTAGSGIHRYTPDGITLTNLRENYNYVDLTIWQPGEYISSTPSGTACTITAGLPTVVNLVSHGFIAGDVIKFTTSPGGTLPNDVSRLVNYHVLSTGLNPDDFQISLEPEGDPVESSGVSTGTVFVGKVKGRAGDDTFAVVPVGTTDISRVAGSKFMFLGEEYVIETYETEVITNEPYARIILNRPLENSVIAYASSYTIKSAVPIRSNGSLGTLTVRISLTRVTSHDLLEIGTGSYADTNYPKEIYGQSVNPPNEATEVKERDVGRVFYVTTDQFGNFKVGPYFKVDQGTGAVTFSSSIALSNLDGLGFKIGVPVSEFSIDSGFTDNATDAVPTENATRIYIERRLGITHDGAKVDDEELLPTIDGGVMPLRVPSGVRMKSDMPLGNFRVIDLGDAILPQDGVNLRSLTFNNFQDTTITAPRSADILTFTGSGDFAQNSTVVGDVTFNIDSTANTVDVQINPDTIINTDVKSDAAIAQSKLNMNAATTRVNASGIVQSDRGLASFDDSQFTSTNGWISLKPNGTVITRLEQIATKTVLGNSTLGVADVAQVAFNTVVSDGGGIKKTQYSGTGFLRRTASGSFELDSDYTVVEAAAGSAASPEANKLIIRNENGDFGARVADLSQIKLDNNLSIDTETTSTGGFIRYYGWDSAGGILIQNGSLASDRKTAYWNNLHDFRTQNGSSSAPIIASSVQCLSLTTGGNTTGGTITGRWTLNSTDPINGSRLQATYSADLAEYYEGDKDYPVGTVLVFGGDKEVTISNKHFDTRVAGVVSNTAAFVMYDACPGFKNLVALQGRVPCRVVGKIRKGDLLVTSNIPGVAISAQENAQVGTVVGKALVNYDSDHIGTIEIAVGRT